MPVDERFGCGLRAIQVTLVARHGIRLQVSQTDGGRAWPLHPDLLRSGDAFAKFLATEGAKIWAAEQNDLPGYKSAQTANKNPQFLKLVGNLSHTYIGLGSILGALVAGTQSPVVVGLWWVALLGA